VVGSEVGGWYVLSCTEGGVGVGLAVVVIRVLRSITGTYGTTFCPLSDEEHNAKLN